VIGDDSHAGERGAASLLAVAMIGVLAVLTSALGVTASLVVDHRRAQAAADLAALAGAVELGRGGDACAAAATIAAANAAALSACSSVGAEVLVSTIITGPRWRDWVGRVEGRARAGPGP
jgi:secretion/DNA translocation related TadE-like protein